MQEWIKNKWKIILAFGIIGLIVIPVLINVVFKIDFEIEFLRAEWDAGDALSFYGVLLAAFLAVYGVYLSIDYSNRNYRDDLRNQVLPFFAVNSLKTKASNNWLNSIMDNEETPKKIETQGYREYKITDYNFALEDGKIVIYNGLTNAQQKVLDNAGFKWIKNGGVMMCVASDHICQPLEIENVGNGAAISFRIGFNRKDTPEKDRKYAYAIPIKVGEKIMVHIFSEDCGKNSPNLGDYVLDMHYKDIYGNEYSQQHDINLDYSDEHSSPVISILYEEKQVLDNK